MMAEQKSKSNKKFMVLSAIGILMVVDCHTFTALDLFGDYIPYNSFFMPMFVFISGYFFKAENSEKLWTYTKKKLKTLIVPYVLISLIAFVLQLIIDLVRSGKVTPLPSGYLLYVLERVVTVGSPFILVIPMWFVITLFSVLMVYALIRKLLLRHWNSFFMPALFCVFHFIAVYIAREVYSESLRSFLLPLKVMFFLPFLELGGIYRDRIEKKHEQLSGGYKLLLLVLLLTINMVRTLYLPYPYDVAFDSLDELTGFTSPYIFTPLVSSVIGITFWLTIADLVGKPFYESRFVNYMSNNTFWIMGLHLAFFNIFNCLLMLINDHIVKLPYFDTGAFLEMDFYYWEIGHNIKLAYLLVGILGPLALKRIFDMICTKVRKRSVEKKSSPQT